MNEEIGMSKVNEVKNLWWDYVYAFDTKHTHTYIHYILQIAIKSGQKRIRNVNKFHFECRF